MRRAHVLPTDPSSRPRSKSARCIVGLNVWASLDVSSTAPRLIDKVYQAVIRLLPGRAARTRSND